MELLSLALTPALLLGAWLSGSWLERRHLKSLLLLESGSSDVLALTIEKLPPGWRVTSFDLVIGNVVISQDYFKRFAGALKGIVGGNIRVFEPLLERARREALIRMKNEARACGHDVIINVRIETTTLASSGSDGKGTAGVEILAFGTAISLDTSPRLLAGGVTANGV
ncbi:MAG: heavy metal-binding domain-containing protein [Gemmatimonadetes bacterium]|nr:heavy metal-binding domain-containing protein [Gemmatimonadota bacterium]MDA1104546.1 heavy metal-binding domain-containing protein [Gemmatimonadota bacterium]